MNRPHWMAGLLYAGAFALYLRTLAPSVAELFDDSLEFQLVGYKLAIAHPTGYPLYSLLLHLFTFLPFGDPAHRTNLASAFFAALAVVLLYYIVLRLTGSVLPALAAAVAFAISAVFWSQAVITEVYALNSVFVCALVLWVVSADPSRLTATIGNNSQFVVLALLWGLALTHHRTIVLLAPALALYLLLATRGRWRALILQVVNYRTALALALPLLLYLYLPMRGAVGSVDGTYQNTPEGFLRWITAGNYNIFLTANPFKEHYDAAFFFNLFLQQFGWIGLALGAIGFVALLRQKPSTGLFLIGAFVTYLLFVVNYRVPDVEVFAIPAFLLLAIAFGVGLHAAARALERLASRPAAGRARVAPLLGGVIVCVILAINFVPLFETAWADNDLSGDTQVRETGLDWLAQPFPPGSRLIGILGEMTLVRYLQATEGLQPALVTVAADRDDDRLAAIEHEIEAGEPVFTTRLLNGLPEKYALGAQGPLVRVWPAPLPSDLPADAARVDTIKYRWGTISQPSADRLRVQVDWEPTAPITTELKVSARLLDGDRLAAQTDDWPVHNAYHTIYWRTGELIHDSYDLQLPAAIAPGSYHVLLIVYRADSGAEAGRLDYGDVKLKP